MFAVVATHSPRADTSHRVQHKDRLVQQHRVKSVVGRLQKAADRVMDIMEDKDGFVHHSLRLNSTAFALLLGHVPSHHVMLDVCGRSRREELAAMSGKDVFSES